MNLTMRTLLLFCFFLPFTLVFGQKKIIDHTIYNNWKKNEAQIVSNNGQYISYEINPHRGDGVLYLYDVKTEKLISFPRGKNAEFSFESDYMAFKITPGFDTLRNCELNKVDKKKWPKDTLGIYIFSKDSLIKVPMLKSFSVEEKNNWLSYLVDENEFPKPKVETEGKKKNSKDQTSTDSFRQAQCGEVTSGQWIQLDGVSSDCHKKKKKKKGEEKPAYKSDGKILTIVDPILDKEYKFKDVTDHLISEKGTYLAFVEHKKEKLDSFQLHLLTLENGGNSKILSKQSSVKSLTFDKSEDYLAFHTSLDTTKSKTYRLNLYNIRSKQNVFIDSTNTIIPSTDAVSENRKPLFTDNGKFMYFGVSDRPEKEEKDTLLESEKLELDIWHYQDKRLQPQQLIELKRDLKKNDLYVYHLSDGTIIKLSDDTLKVRPSEKLVGDYIFGVSDEKYALENQWEVPNKEDHYRISVANGSVDILKKGVGFNGDLSPAGNYYSYFSAAKKQYYLIDLLSKVETCITCSEAKVNWQSDINGMPMDAYPFGVKGYSNGEKEIYIQSQYDLWVYSISDKKLVSITNKEGEQLKIRLEPKMWSYDSTYFDFENLYIEGFDEKTKGTHLYNLIKHGDHTDFVEKYYTDHKINAMNRSKNKETIVFRKMSLLEYPETRISRDDFKTEAVLSSTNPQQEEYNWATVELISWKSYDGIPLEGLLYKPENFDATKKYPLMIYYYELYSDDLHNHYVPKPTASIIYPTEYASAGYVVFIPDIRYKVGHPAKSAYDCIMSGTDRVLKLLPNVDSTRMGLQGQSWGGYQTAQLITMTTRYAAAMAGAPVSNMFSAYGGIRWGSGVNRQFQYERTQSRIGKTIWEAPELYVENSPLFHIPKIHTPLLIMHNDKDGAVPWYQGIEMFTAMKRLGKPCWLLNYNGDDHNLMQNTNRMDLSIRMRQFFDYYLLGQTAPKWLIDGIPAVDKGKELGY